MSYAVSITQDGAVLDTAGKYVDQDIVVGMSDSIKLPAQTYTPTTTDQTIAAGQYLSGAQTVKGDANLVAGNIKKDVEIFGVTGTHEGGGEAIPDISNAPDVDGYDVCCYYLIRLGDPRYDDFAEGGYYTKLRAEIGTLNGNQWVTTKVLYDSQTTVRPARFDWSDQTGNWCIIRFLFNMPRTSASLAFTVRNNVVAKKIQSNQRNPDGLSALRQSVLAQASLRELYFSGRLCYGGDSKGADFSGKPVIKVFDASRCNGYTVHNRFFYTSFSDLPAATSIKLPVTPVDTGIDYPEIASMFNDCASVPELDLSCMRYIVNASNAAKMFSSCVELKTLALGVIFMDSVSSASNTFTNCVSLTNLTLHPISTLPGLSFSLEFSKLLTDSSLVDIANALPAVSTAKVLTLHSTPKGRLPTIHGTVSRTVSSMTSAASDTVSVNAAAFIAAVSDVDGKYVFTYDGSAWTDSSGTAVNLADYGVSLVGEAASGNIIAVRLRDHFYADDSGTVNLQDFITTYRGWTIA